MNDKDKVSHDSKVEEKKGLRLEVRRIRTQIREGVIEEYGQLSDLCDTGTGAH
ncbi:Hypothetical protein A7982_04558 [Minicystis rosea]|nr:Hypothetical protein A7982_04558 [Minicystis rosea]